MKDDDRLKQLGVIDDKPKNVEAHAAEPTISPFHLALADLLEWHGDATGGEWRVSENYRGLFSCLTPRQIKSFLRERLMLSDTEAGAPAVSFLRVLFHPIWRLYRDEEDLFRVLRIAANGALALMPEESRQEGKLRSVAADFFFTQLQSVAGRSAVLSEKDIDACWPRKSEERALLVNLLALIGTEETARLTGSSSLLRFPDWVKQRLGEAPIGITPNEQVSSFQDMALQRYRAGDKTVLRTVAEYADDWIDKHFPEFDSSIAPSLSNLAVLINDLSGVEPQCDHLFSAAIKLMRPGFANRIPYYYVEFVLDVLADENRRERLVASRYEGQEAKLEKFAKKLLERLPDTDLEPTDRFYRDILRERIELRRETERTVVMIRAWALTKAYAPVLVSGGAEPSSRLNDLLDATIGRGAALLSTKEPLQCMVWAAQLKTDNPGWPMATQIANDLVGESQRNSVEERCGLGLNAMLVTDSAFLLSGERQRVAAIWSQVGTLLAQRLGKPAGKRIALAFLASQMFETSAQTIDRMRKAAQLLKLAGDWQGESWVRLLGDDDKCRPILQAVVEDPENPDAARNLADIVFASDYPRIETPFELSMKLGWHDQSYAWAGDKTIDAAAEELAAAAKGSLGGMA